MARLLLILALLIPLMGHSASKLVEATSRVAIASNKAHSIPIRKLPCEKFTIASFSAIPLRPFADFVKKYAEAEVVDANDVAKIKPDAPTIIVLNGSDSNHTLSARRLAERLHKLIAVVWFDAPANAPGLFSQALLTAADTQSATQAAAAQALFGGIDITDTDGYVIPRSRLGFATAADMDMEPNLDRRIDSIVEANLKANSFQGCRVVVARRGNVVIDKSYGIAGIRNQAVPVTDSTLYDVASLTKILATVPAMMKLFDTDRVSMETKPSETLTALRRDGLRDLTMAEFLYHRTGLPATISVPKLFLDSISYTEYLHSLKKKRTPSIKFTTLPGLLSDCRNEEYFIPVAADLYASSRMTELVDSAVYNAPLRARTYLYSCLNFCILKDYVEARIGTTINKYLDRLVYGPIGAYRTCYRPTTRYPQEQIAPTERDLQFRHQTLQGYVHDEIAAYSGGVQGNAGLFCTALDAAKICQTWLQGGSYGGVDIFKPSTVALFTNTTDSISGRAPGFDRSSRTKSWRSTGLSDRAYGHTGFTGTCCWVDPELELVYVFLCNRIYPSRTNPTFSSNQPRETILYTIIQSIKK